MDINLSGQVAIISGGLGDIGKAIVASLARCGASVAVGDIRPEGEAEPFIEALHASGAGIRYDRVDIADPHAVAEWVENVVQELGTPTLVIPNAAIVTLKGVCEVTPAEWNRELAINLSGAFYLAQATVRHLLNAKLPGRIVFIGSWAAEAPHTGLPTYSVSKAGLRMLMRSLALNLASNGILVNEIAPGYVDAGLSGQIFADYPEIRANAERTVPLGTLITPDDVARQVLYLCDPENRQMTGSVVLMDGGLSLITPGRQHE
jgi:glucose 1-dehydrogenase